MPFACLSACLLACQRSLPTQHLIFISSLPTTCTYEQGKMAQVKFPIPAGNDWNDAVRAAYEAYVSGPYDNALWA